MQAELRVSTILSQLKDFSTIDPEVLSKKAKIGTRTHQAIDDFLSDDPFTIHCDRSKLYFDSFKKWYDTVSTTTSIKYILKETRFYDHQLLKEYGYSLTGQVDAVIELQGKTMLLDYKTSANRDDEIWPLQAHFYHHLLKSNNVAVADKMIFLKLHRYGELPEVCEYYFLKDKMNYCKELAKKYCESRLNIDNKEYH